LFESHSMMCYTENYAWFCHHHVWMRLSVGLISFSGHFDFFMVEWRYAVHVETLVHFPEFSFDYVCFLMLNTSCSCLMIDWGMLEMMIRMLHSQTLDVWILPRKFEVDWLLLILLLFHWIWTNHNISWPRPKLCRFVKWRGYLPICHAVNHVWPPFHVFCSCFIQYFTHLPKFIFNSF
jgi:hypothetical protein